MARLLKRLFGGGDGAPLAPGERLRHGWPPAALPFLLLVPLLWAGPIRTITQLSLTASFVLALVSTLVALLPFRADLLERDPPGAWWRSALSSAALALAVAGSIGLLYNRFFGGLVNYAGGDGGEHVANALAFADRAPGIYSGFTSMYGVVYGLIRLCRLDVFWGFVAAFYVGVALTTAVPMIATLSAVRGLSRAPTRIFVAAVGVAFVSNGLVQYFAILPIEHYNQSDGFFVHMFALVPLLGIWLLDGLVRPRRLRLLALVGGVVLYRYTYGLNLSDLLLAVSVLLLLESQGPELSVGERWLLRAGTIPLVFGAAVILHRLRPLLDHPGWIREYETATVLSGQLLCVAVLTLVVTGSAALGLERGLQRWLRLPIVFGLINAGTLVGLSALPPASKYYLFKYGFHGVVLLGAGLAVAMTSLLVSRDGLPRVWRGRIAALAALLVVIGLWDHGYRDLRPSFVERAYGSPPFQHNRPLVDLGAWQRIGQVLRDSQKQFGGYLTSNFPLFNFMNAGLGYYNGGQPYFKYGKVKQEPGYCVFWEDPTVKWWGEWEARYPQRAAQEALHYDALARCQSYGAHWEPTRTRTLCHRCY